MENICRFIPGAPAPDTVRVLNFVYETKRVCNSEAMISSVYRIQLVTEGSATVRCGVMQREVRAGDIFFIFPSVPYVIDGSEGLKYMYISFIGIRANILLERLRIDSRNFVFDSFGFIEDMWREGIEAPDGLIDLFGESVLLHTLGKIGERCAPERKKETAGVSDRFLLVKKYIDDNFSDNDLSLELLATEFSYCKKYLSVSFKRHFKIGINEYVNTIRISSFGSPQP